MLVTMTAVLVGGARRGPLSDRAEMATLKGRNNPRG